MHRSVPSLLLAAAAVAAGLPSHASAQCDVYRLDIPDFDQRREAAPGILGLPNNGSVHCGPTAAMNWLAYITNHGYPEVLSGARDWQSGAHYNTVTSLINWLGTIMGTVTGTYASDQGDGVTEWLEMTSPGNFTVAVHAPSGGSYAPSPEQIYELMTAGALVTLCTAHWEYKPPYSGPDDQGNDAVYPARYVRKGGGHCVSVARITDGCSDEPRVWFRDPAGFDGPDKTSQAQFVTQYLDTEPVTAYYAAEINTAPIFRTMHRFVDDDPNRHSMINALVAITPLGALSADAEQGTISVLNQHRGDSYAVVPTQTFNTPGNAPILDVAYLPHLGAAAVLTRTDPDRGTLYRFRPGTGEFTPIATLDRPGDMAVGLAGEIYVVQRAGSSHPGGVNVCMADGSVRFIRASSTPSALAYDDATGRLGMVFHDRHVLATVPIDPRTGAASDYLEQPLPPNLVLPSEISFAFGSFHGGVYIAAGDVTGDGIIELVSTPNGWALNDAHKVHLSSPRNIQVDRRGRILCTSQGSAFEFALDANGGWRVNPEAKFAGRSAGDIFQVTVGRSGRDDLQTAHQIRIDNPADFPSAPAECPADFNNSGAASVQDIFDFLAAYFAADPHADFNASGATSVQDIFDFLAAYFAGCP
jgi:prepilin-type processing-associated H-X9-DG protein